MNWSALIRTATTVAALCAATVVRPQLPLAIDTTFRLSVVARNAFSLVFMPDGQLLVSGQFDFPDEFPNGTYQRGMLKVSPNGEIDWAYPCCYGSAKITPWQDRYYVGVGQVIHRVLEDGNLDPDFIEMNSDPYFSSLQGGDYHVFDDGRVLLTGLHTIDAPQLGFEGAYNLIWFTNEGRLDTTRIHRSGNGINWRIQEVPEGTSGDLGGKFLLHTWGTKYDGHTVDKVLRIHADGTVDTSFDSNIEWGYIWQMLPLPDGRSYITGQFRMAGGNDTLQVVRLMPDGSLDPSFNNALDFRKEVLVGIDAGVNQVFPIGPGLLLLCGSFEEVDGQPRKSICMLDTLGNLLGTYLSDAGCGTYQYQIGQLTQTYGSIEGIAQAPDGDYYIWGAYHGYTDGTTNDTLQRLVTRLHGGDIGLGVTDQRAHPPAFTVYPNPSGGNVTVALEQLPKNAVLVLRDALGRTQLRQQIRHYQTTLDLQHLPNGCYHAELVSNGERIGHQRLVVQH